MPADQAETGLPPLPPVGAPAWVRPVAAAALVLLPCGMAAIAFRTHAFRVEFFGQLQGWLITSGKAAGLAALTLVMLQFAMSARLRLLDRAFGLDRLMRVHRYAGAAAGVLAVAHPLLLFAADNYRAGPMDLSSWPLLLGAAVLTLLAVVLCTSLWRAFLMLPYGVWLWIHRLVFVIAAAAVTHALRLGADLSQAWARTALLVLFGAYAALFAWVKAARPILLLRRRFSVAAVRQLNHNVCRLELTPISHPGLVNLPGQFAFLRIKGRNVPSEEHPFTISSPPARDGAVAFTIKASGDFTRLIPHVAPGDRAKVHGPFGRFSFLARTQPGRPLVMIAGGVGVTPMLSMLGYLAEADPQRQVTFIWANRRQRDIFDMQWLEQIAARMPHLDVHHVLAEQPDWPGERGLLDRAVLDRLLPANRGQADVYLCGPPAMMDSVRSSLLKLGVRRRGIHTERFQL